MAPPVGGTPGARTKHLAAADLGARTQSQPRTGVLDVGKATQVRADLREYRHYRGDRQPVDARQVHSRPARQGRACIKLRGVLAAPLPRPAASYLVAAH